MVEYKYKLEVAAGSYYANSLLGLWWEVMRHRWFHLRRGDGWVD